MKIGEFASHCKIPISKVRYYVDDGLLMPGRKGSQYYFSSSDLDDMNLIQELKDMSFNLNDIKRYLQIVRFYDASDQQMDLNLIPILCEKNSALKRDRSLLNASINAIDLKIKSLQPPDTRAVAINTPGIPLEFIPHLVCPKCKMPFSLKGAGIQNNSIISGEFKCTCNYSLLVEDGILVSTSKAQTDYYSSLSFNMQHYQEIPSNNQDFVYFQYMNAISSEAAALISKSYVWIDNIIFQMNTKKNIIFAPDLSSHFLYRFANKPYFKEALIVVSCFTKQNVLAIKSHIENVAPHLKILYIANTICDLPLRKHCVDLWIDSLASYNYSFFHDNSLYEKIDRFIKPGAHVVGYTKYYPSNSMSRVNIDKIYPNHEENHYSIQHFKQLFRKYDYKLVEELEIGYSKHPGSYYEYHVPGEKQCFYTFHAQKKI